MNVGDRLLCKKKRNETILFVLKGKWYEVCHIGMYDIHLIGDSNKVNPQYNEMAFRKEWQDGYYYLYDFFYSKKELLNMKLKKIKIV